MPLLYTRYWTSKFTQFRREANKRWWSALPDWLTSLDPNRQSKPFETEIVELRLA